MREKEHIRRSHNVTLLLYHIVLPAKYRRKVFSATITKSLLEVCEIIEETYEIYFLEIGSDEDHIHFMIQWLPSMSVTEIITKLKSKTSTYLFDKHWVELRKKLRWGKLRTSWYYANTVWAFAWEQTIRNYIRNQGFTKYDVRYENQLQLWQQPLFSS
jgi:putative transposase